jgi:hypothetical protein
MIILDVFKILSWTTLGEKTAAWIEVKLCGCISEQKWFATVLKKQSFSEENYEFSYFNRSTVPFTGSGYRLGGD